MTDRAMFTIRLPSTRTSAGLNGYSEEPLTTAARALFALMVAEFIVHLID